MKADELILPIGLILGIFGGLGAIITMNEVQGGNWANVSNYVAPAIIAIAVFALIIIAIMKAR